MNLGRFIFAAPLQQLEQNEQLLQNDKIRGTV